MSVTFYPGKNNVLGCTSMEGATEGQIRKVGRCPFKEGTRCLSTEKERKEKLGENPNRDELGSDDGAVIVLAQMERKRSFYTG